MNKTLTVVIIMALCMATIAPGLIHIENNIVKAATPVITVGGKKSIKTGSVGTLRFPSCTVAQNGELVVSYVKGSGADASCYHKQYIMLSDDNGSTFYTEYLAHEFPFYAESLWSLITAPNGDILFLVNNNQEWLEHNGTDIWRNTNNGAEGYWSFSNNFTEFGQCYVYDWMVFGERIYAFMNYPHIFEPEARAKIVYSDDSGYTWQQMGNDIGSFGGEWCALPLNGNATHWKTVHRNLPNIVFSGTTFACTGTPAHFKHYANMGENYETTDGGVTWSATGENCPEECGWGYSYQTDGSGKINKGNALFWLDDQVIVACIETSELWAEIWTSSDNMSSWGDNNNLGYEGYSCVKNAYTRGCALPDRNDDRGGWGLLIWSEDCNTKIDICYVYNNADQPTYDGVPGPTPNLGIDEETEDIGDIYFISINEYTNNSVISGGVRNYNARTVNDTNWYEIQIANDSIFTDVFADIKYINETQHTTNFFTDSYNFTFNDTSVIEDYGGSYGRHYYRYRSYYTTVSD